MKIYPWNKTVNPSFRDSVPLTVETVEPFSTDDTDVIWQASTMHLLSTYALRTVKYGTQS